MASSKCWCDDRTEAICNPDCRLIEERDRYRQALERFGRHEKGCPAEPLGSFGKRCVCGLHAALAFHAPATNQEYVQGGRGMSTYIERAEMWEQKARDHLHAAFHKLGAGSPGLACTEAREAAEALFKADGERYYAREAEKARAADKEHNS